MNHTSRLSQDLDVEKTLVAAHLRKQGLRIKIPEGYDPNPQSLAGIGLITHAELEKFGFILLEDDTDPQTASETIVNDICPLFPHSDGQGSGTKSVENVLSIRFTPQFTPRNTRTGIADRDHLFMGVVDFVVSHASTDLCHALMTLKTAVKQSVHPIDPMSFRKPSGQLWKDWVFHEEASFVTEGNFPGMRPFLKAMEPYFYLHQWSEKQRILIDDSNMAHARMPLEGSSSSKNGFLLQSLWQWTPNGVLRPSPMHVI